MGFSTKSVSALFLLFLLLFLTLGLSTPVLGGEPIGEIAEPAAEGELQGMPASGEDPAAAVEDPPPLDCKDTPPTGKHALLGGDNEIFAAITTTTYGLQIDKLDNNDNGIDLLVDWGWKLSMDDLYHYGGFYPAIVTADFDGDKKDEVASAFMNVLGQLEIIALKNPDAEKADLVYDYVVDKSQSWPNWDWWASIDIAAGNLDATASGGDAAEEVAVVYSDRNHDLNVFLLDGEADGGIKSLTKWKSTANGRGNANSVNVAVGDLDGDGNDDEIVVAIVDGNHDLQVIILQLDGGTVKELGWNHWTADDRGNMDPVGEHFDVVTGDFDTNGTDEVVVVFRDGSNALQLGLIAYTADGDTPQDHVLAHNWWRNTNNGRGDVVYVSAATADIDGDSRDEIVTAFADSNGRLQLVTFDVIEHVLSLRGSYAAGSASGISVDAGDIDKDGLAEVVAAYRGNPGPGIISFDDPGLEDGANHDDLKSGLVRRDKWTGGQPNKIQPMMGLALGDVDGDSVYGTYTLTCERLQEARVLAMINLPPYWQDLNPNGNQVAYGKEIKGGEEEGKEVSTSFGASATFGAEFKVPGFEFKDTITTSWKQSLSRSWTQGSRTITKNGWSSGQGFVAYKDLTYYIYQYKRDGGGDEELARISTPVDHESDTKLFSIWNKDEEGGRYLFPTTWVPAYRTAWLNEHVMPDELNEYNEGAGSDLYDIDGDGNLDLLFSWIEDVRDTSAPTNIIHHRIGWNVDSNGTPASWSADFYNPRGSGWYNSGLGAAVAELNGNDTPELIVAWADSPHGTDNIFYRVGWDMAISGANKGEPDHWSGEWKITGWLGGNTEGAGLDIVDINNSGRPDFIFGWINNPADGPQGHYGIGWEMTTAGTIGGGKSDPMKIEGPFGSENFGLGLSVDDMDKDGTLDLAAAWVHDPEGENDWAYAIGEKLDQTGAVTSWIPGHHVPGWVGSETDGAALATADLGHGDDLPEMLAGWINDPKGANGAHNRVGKYWEIFGGEVDQRPKGLKDDKEDDGQFELMLNDRWWNVAGDLLFRWDETQGHEAIKVGVGSANPTWSVTKEQFGKQTEKTSESFNFTVGGEAKIAGFIFAGSETVGTEHGSSYAISWVDGFYLDGKSEAIPFSDPPPYDKEYKYIPFTYIQKATSKTGVEHAYMVLDYFVDYPLPLAANRTVVAAHPPLSQAALAAPAVPIINSATHPTQETWIANNNPSFTWKQPSGDTAVVDGYRWYMDRIADTVPEAFVQNLVDGDTYEGLSDGLWYLHVRARGAGGEWSDTSHRAVRVDLNAPLVEIKPDRPYPANNGGWYNAPVTIAIEADDGAGSGVQSIEVSADGTNWQPYSGPITIDANLPLATFLARATDHAGHVSESTAIDFGFDQTAPSSAAGPGCWQGAGVCAAEVLTDAAGNEYLQLAGKVNDALSGVRGVSIQIGDEYVTTAGEVDNGRWSYSAGKEIGAGCHNFSIWAEDMAGNVEPVHSFASGVVWHPREKPNLSGSSFNATPSEARPGESVNFVLVLRNSSAQETWVPVTVTVPSGLEIDMESILGGGVYDPGTRTINWSPEYVWPGAARTLSFSAQVSSDHPAATLDIPLEGFGTWPVSDSCPVQSLPLFDNLATELKMTVKVKVNPDLPHGADVLPPNPPIVTFDGGVSSNSQDVQLLISTDVNGATARDAAWMFVREWIWNADQEVWRMTQESGWVPYSSSIPWTLSEGDGVKYIGVWLADKSWNISELEGGSLAFVNLMNRRQSLANGERIQYRFPLSYQQLAIFNSVAREGDPNLFAWQPNNGFRPDYSATGTGYVDTIGFETEHNGLYLVEVQANGDSAYQLLTGGDVPLGTNSALAATADTPQHPLTVSDPRSAGDTIPPDPPGTLKTYFPFLIQSQ